MEFTDVHSGFVGVTDEQLKSAPAGHPTAGAYEVDVEVRSRAPAGSRAAAGTPSPPAAVLRPAVLRPAVLRLHRAARVSAGGRNGRPAVAAPGGAEPGHR